MGDTEARLREPQMDAAIQAGREALCSAYPATQPWSMIVDAISVAAARAALAASPSTPTGEPTEFLRWAQRTGRFPVSPEMFADADRFVALRAVSIVPPGGSL
jgi:hypothetical protein